MTNAEIIDEHELTFDPGDKLNASLYLCVKPGSAAAANVVAGLRADGLWSAEPTKQVEAAHRDAYKAQLRFVAALRYEVDGEPLLVARFDHEKFPSDDGRWAAWQTALDGRYPRLDAGV